MTDFDRPLDIDADLLLTVDDESIEIRGYGDLVVVAAPSLAAVRQLAGERPPSVDEHLLQFLEDAGVTIDVRVRGRSVARAGPGIDPGPLSRAVGIVSARVSPGGLLLAALAGWDR